ncbi:hypothetical protein OROMI_032481 [Orobanche minor]
MGVHGLWELLAPVGRRVSVETLAGKRLAIDASIWMIQFMKAMRDEKGEMVRNAHILGFFRRICKLLYLRTKPVFVFDGGTPALKRRTVIARRRQRDNAQAKIRKTAEKLLLNHLKQMRLQELAADLEKQRRDNVVKGKKPIMEVLSNEKDTEKGNSDVAVNCNQEELDQMLAASLSAEENEGYTRDASTSGGGVKEDEVFGDEDEDDEDEEMILPEMHGKVDPAVLAALPPSMQLDLLVQMRERLMAENRQKYQKVKKAPSRFSELQIESYLKTVAFRREIDGAQKAASGRGIGGMQTSRIASEANREYIFSSSFTGDKQALTSVGQESSEANRSRAPPANLSTDSVNEVLSSRRSGGVAGPSATGTGNEAFHEGVETYMDERGRLRVSRVRALGIHMTRDLQRNLDLMKEIDREKAETSQEMTTSESNSIRNPVDVRENSSDIVTDKNNVVSGTSIEISFEDILENAKGNDDDDEVFARLVAGDQVTDFPINNSDSVKQSLNTASDNEWEEGLMENKSLHGVGVSDEGEVEWEEGFQDIELKSSSFPDKSITKGAREEEANIQEAIRRSLEDAMGFSLMNDAQEDHVMSKGDSEMVSEEEDSVFVYEGEGGEEGEIEGSSAVVSKKTVTNGAFEKGNIQKAIKRSLEDTSGRRSTNDFPEDHVISKGDRDMVSEEEDRAFVYEGKEKGPEIEAATANVNLQNSANALAPNFKELKSAEFVELIPDRSNLKLLNQDAGVSGALSAEILGYPLSSTFTSSQQMSQATWDDHSCSASELGKISAFDSVIDADGTNELGDGEKIYGDFLMEKEEIARKSSFGDNHKDQEMESRLEEEMIFLGKEREELGSEQRKLERNSESVSNEMFAECQELLQMFGLPYIIAPMEAEAQCAFMELSNLVDGVVTDDSDTFLFGARSVYKNIFDDRKYVETYFMKDIENELGLDREKLIHMALLLGSDYTEGISGIGIVNAIEVVNAFPGKDGLREFRELIESPDPSILGKLDVETGVNLRKKVSEGSESAMNGSGSNPEHADDRKRKQLFMDKHRNVSKNWQISSSFPSDAVISAYAVPQVDKSTETLSWGKPDLFVLRKLCWEKFGWGTSKADELLVPVLKEYNKRETQLRLEAFYTFNERFAKIRSKRIKKAVKEITKHKPSELMDETTLQQPRKRKANPCGNEADQSGVVLEGLDGAGPTNESIVKPNIKQIKSGRKESCARGKRRGRGKGQTSVRGRRKKSSETETGGSESDEEMQFDESEESCRARRSGRTRKAVNYNVSDEFGDSDDNEVDENRLKKCSMSEKSCADQTIDNQGNNGNGLNKTRSGSIDDNKMDGHLEERRLSEDYLQLGGGFCADEDGKMKETNNNNGLDFADPSVEGNNELNMNDETRINYPLLDDDTLNDSGVRCSKSLRSMPNLKRKKRKN